MRLLMRFAIGAGCGLLIGCADTQRAVEPQSRPERQADPLAPADPTPAVAAHPPAEGASPTMEALNTGLSTRDRVALRVSTEPPSDAMRADPTLAELPDLRIRDTRAMAGKIGVMDMNPSPRFRLVPDIQEPPLTPEERAAIGADKKPPGDDLLAFYRPARGPEHGVAPFESRISSGIFGQGGGQIGLNEAKPGAGSWGIAGHHAEIDAASRAGAKTYGRKPRTAAIGVESPTPGRIGEERKGAKHKDTLD